MSGPAESLGVWEQMDQLLGSRAHVDARVIAAGVFSGPAAHPPDRDLADQAAVMTDWVVLRCPEGHNITPLRLLLGHDAFVAVHIDQRFTHRVEVATLPGSFLGADNGRMHLTCAQKRHRYRSTWTRDELVKRVTVALVQRRTELHLD